MDFKVGQHFDKTYPPEAAVYCNKNNCFIEANPNGGYDIKEIPAPTEKELFDRLRSMRNAKLTETDKYVSVPDYPISEKSVEDLKVYREELRNLPSQEGAPWDGGGEATPWPEFPDITK